MKNNVVIKEVTTKALINAVVNGTITWFLLKQPPYYITQDSISFGSNSVIGEFVVTALVLAFSLSVISAKSLINKAIKTNDPELENAIKYNTWYKVLKLAAKNGVFTFGILIIVGVMWQRIFGTIEVNALVTTLITAFMSAMVTALAVYSTLNNLINSNV